jgi:hypothetical protein
LFSDTRFTVVQLDHFPKIGLPSRSSRLGGKARLRTSCFSAAAFVRHVMTSEGW